MTFLAKKLHFPPQFFWELGRGSTPESSVYLAPRLPKGVNMMSLRGFRRGFRRRHSTEIRASHIDHFEFALCFPPSPYPSCQLDAPDYGMARQGDEVKNMGNGSFLSL
jgi:hypothetical protein